jgi:hypothetical protein
MWQPYIDSVRAHLPDPDSKIVFDRYHIMRYLTTAVDTARKREHRTLAAAGDTRLAGSKYLWLYSAENLPERYGERFAALRAVDLKTGRAWAIKESRRRLWNYYIAPRLGRQALAQMVLMGHPLPPTTRHRCGEDPQAPRGRPAGLLCPPDHQRRRGKPQLAYPGDPGLRPRLPQPKPLQDRHLLPLRRASAPPTDPRSSRMSLFCKPQVSRLPGQDCADYHRRVGPVGRKRLTTKNVVVVGIVAILLAGCEGTGHGQVPPHGTKITPSSSMSTEAAKRSPESTTAALPNIEWDVAVLGRIDMCGVCQRGSSSVGFTKVLAGKFPTGQTEGTIAVAGMASHLLPEGGVTMYQSKDEEIVFLCRAEDRDLYTVVEIMKATPENLAVLRQSFDRSTRTPCVNPTR